MEKVKEEAKDDITSTVDTGDTGEAAREQDGFIPLPLIPVPSKYCNHPTISQPHKNPNESEMYLHVDFSKLSILESFNVEVLFLIQLIFGAFDLIALTGVRYSLISPTIETIFNPCTLKELNSKMKLTLSIVVILSCSC